MPLTVYAEDRVLAQDTYEPPEAPCCPGAKSCGGTAEQQPAAEPEKDFGRRAGETTQEYLKREVRQAAQLCLRRRQAAAVTGYSNVTGLLSPLLPLSERY